MSDLCGNNNHMDNKIISTKLLTKYVLCAEAYTLLWEKSKI